MMELKEIIEIVKATKGIVTDRQAAHKVTEKGLADYVTQVDMGVQEFVRKKLMEVTPDIQFMAEESKDKHFNEEKRAWILDPIDGTTNLIHDYKQSAVSLGLFDGGEIVMGVVYNPFTEELFYGEKGKGAYLNGARLFVQKTEDLGHCLVSVGTSPYDKEALAAKNFELFQRIFMKCEDIRRGGAASLDLCYVAAGRTDAYFERNLKPWDYAAGSVILKEAGGKVTTFTGEALVFQKPCDVLATNGCIHDRMLKEIQE